MTPDTDTQALHLKLTPLELITLIRVCLMAQDEARCEGNDTVETTCRKIIEKARNSIPAPKHG